MTYVDPATKSMDDLVALCKRRGFVYPASEIYGGLNGFWDYGPLGTALKNNIRDWWWRCMVEAPPIGPDGDPVEIVGVDTAIIQNPRTWVASGHVGGFSDPMQTCRQCKKLVRADHVRSMLSTAAWPASLADSLEHARQAGDTLGDVANVLSWADSRSGKKHAPGLADGIAQEESHALAVRDIALLSRKTGGLASEVFATTCPHCAGRLTEPRDFNLMFESYTGAVRDEDAKVYLRPETAQGIFLNFKNVLDTMRVRVPFGIAQVGKSFRNELTPRNFIFRSREFEQMEMEFFCPPDQSQQWYQFWRQERYNWWLTLGIDPRNLTLRDHDADELSHYSSATVDVEYKYPFSGAGFGELEGVAHRGCFDLTQHKEHSGKDLSYFDQELQLRLQAEGVPPEVVKERSRYIPHVIEPASGLTRAVLVLLCEAYTPDDSRPSKVFMKFKPKFAPVKAGIYPLVNKDGMPEVAHKLYLELRQKYAVEYDAKQAIGKRYARMDEIGTPYCFTVDGDTLKDQTVTVRDRDTQTQERIGIDKVAAFLAEKLA